MFQKLAAGSTGAPFLRLAKQKPCIRTPRTLLTRRSTSVTSSAERLSESLGLTFRDISLLQTALSHRSWCAENGGAESNERLEFLGDAVLGLVVTTHLYATYPDYPEGELAKIRAAVVSTVSLAEVASEIGLGQYLALGRGEDQSGGRKKRSILADAVEAVIGATYLDAGWSRSVDLIMKLIGERIVIAAAGPGGQDFKTRLQELCAHDFENVPRYTVSDHGPDHDKRFIAHVTVNGEQLGEGEGRSKKAAEQSAAAVALRHIARAQQSEESDQRAEKPA